MGRKSAIPLILASQESSSTKLHNTQSTRRIKKIKTDFIELIEHSKQEKKNALKAKNKESAQRHRDNKKKYIISLENQLHTLTLENDILRKQIAACRCHSTNASDDSLSSSSSNALQKPIDAGIDDVPMLVQENELVSSSNNSEDSFERISVRSFSSCSNFLLLSIVCALCVLGCLDMGSSPSVSSPPASYYDMDSIQTISKKYERMRQEKQRKIRQKIQMKGLLNVTLQPKRSSFDDPFQSLAGVLPTTDSNYTVISEKEKRVEAKPIILLPSPLSV